MQSDQHTSNHPIPLRNGEGTSAIDAAGNLYESDDGSGSQEVSEPQDAIKPGPGRRPARSEANTPRFRR